MAAASSYVSDFSEHPDDDGPDGMPLTDKELAQLRKLREWSPEVHQYSLEDYGVNDTDFEDPADVEDDLHILPSAFTEFAFQMPTYSGYENFSFEGRRHLQHIYDTPRRRLLLLCGRQVEKSTLLGNKAIGLSCLIPAYNTLYVSPSATQTKTFSNDRIKDPIETSPVLRNYTTHMLSQNIFEKQFINRSKITLRYAFLNADRVRGIPANQLLIDEIQHVLADNIPVIEQCLFHSPKRMKRYIYSGTPLSLDNVLEDYWANRSTQNQWVIPCDCTGGDEGRYWNILGEKNIGKKHLICEHCGKQLFPMCDGAQWASTVAYDPVHTPFEGYRIPQLMVPWLDWNELLYNFHHHSRNRFYNEALGISFDSGLRPLSRAQVRANCNPRVYMSDVAKYQKLSLAHPVFAGIDWGTGENTYTVLSLGMYVGNKFRIFYIHRFTGEDIDVEVQQEKIFETLRAFNVRLIGADYGGGYYPNDFLTRRFGRERVLKYQYVARLAAKLRWEAKLQRYVCHRTEVMSAVFNAIKRANVFEFPRWEEFKDPYASDMLNIFSEYNERLRMTQYGHTAGKTDDSLHSILLCFLASMIVRPRPDIISPNKEMEHAGAIWSSYSGPVDQG